MATRGRPKGVKDGMRPDNASKRGRPTKESIELRKLALEEAAKEKKLAGILSGQDTFEEDDIELDDVALMALEATAQREQAARDAQNAVPGPCEYIWPPVRDERHLDMRSDVSHPPGAIWSATPAYAARNRPGRARTSG
jgi:hypothetical protein